MRKCWPAISCAFAVGWLMTETVLAREGKRVTPKELLKQGFFQDFEELDLEALLTFSDITLKVATRTEQAPEDAPSAVSIITGDDIHVMGARTLEDVLRVVPGVDVTIDGLGRPRISMRGLGSGGTGGASENVLVLMNGLRLDDPLEGGATAINYLIPVGNIQKIEILRGPGSALYGSGAMGGVINIITFTQRDFTGIEASAGGGSFTSQDYSLKIASESRAVKIAGYIDFQDTNGARQFIPADVQTGIDRQLAGLGVPAASLAPGRANDHLRLLETNYAATYRDYDFHLRVSAQRTPGYVGVADSLGTVNDLIHRQISFDASHRRDLADGWTLNERIEFLQSGAKRTLDAFPPGFTQPVGSAGSFIYPSGVFAEENLNSRRYGVEGIAQKTFLKHQVQLGLDLGRESASGNEFNANYDFRTATPLSQIEPVAGVVTDQGRGVFSLYAQDVWTRSSKVTLTGGLRFDHYGGVGGQVSPRLAAVFRLPKEVNLKVLYGRAFRMPTLGEQYFSLPGFLGNEDLKAMTTDTLEASVSYAQRRLRLSAGVFQSFVRHEIVADGVFVAGESRPLVNGSGRDVHGLELELRQGFGVGSSFFVDYAYQHAQDKATDEASADVPSHIGSVGATFAFAKSLRATPSLAFCSSRPRAVGDLRAPVSGYALVNLALRAPDIYHGVVFSLSVQNMLNKLYFDSSPAGGVPGDYPRPGRRIFLNATYQF